MGLRLPDYFGMNWDAFNELILDLSWLPRRQVVIVHDDVPLADDSHDRGKYLAVITDVTAHRIRVGELDFLVVFPAACRHEVERHR